MSSRKIAIICRQDDYFENVENTVRAFAEAGLAEDIAVYTKSQQDRFAFRAGGGACRNAVLPAECDTEPKARNWVNAQYEGFDGFLHVLTDTVEILKDPSQFLAQLEAAMKALDYSVWLSTVTDPCNFVYSKYNPRIRISCDRDECAKIGLGGDLCFTSHSNTQWMAYNMGALAGSDLLKLDERFAVPMFFIIELLARRKATKNAGDLYYMNQYLTVGSEYGTFRTLLDAKKEQSDPKAMQAEDAVFKSMNLNYAPDNAIDPILEALWDRISAKAARA